MGVCQRRYAQRRAISEIAEEWSQPLGVDRVLIKEKP